MELYRRRCKRASKLLRQRDAFRETTHNYLILETSLSPLLPFFDTARSNGETLALATVLNTAGSTYRKSGAQMLIAASGDYIGLLSGGCLESDLREHARDVIASGRARRVSYDMRSPDDEIWGLGAGCEGAMEIYLQRLGPAEQWQPIAGVSDITRSGERAVLTLRISDAVPGEVAMPALQFWVWRHAQALAPPLHCASANAALSGAIWRAALESARVLCGGAFVAPESQNTAAANLVSLPYAPAPALLILGAGPDARPVAELAHFLGWRLSIYDHRPALLSAARFPAGARLMGGAAESLLAHFNPMDFDATVVMSHHLATDRSYLRVLAQQPCNFTGLLGPAPRREKLLAGLNENEVAALRPRLHAPVGLDLGGRSPEAIALSIIADIHAHFQQKHAPGRLALARR